LAEEKFYIVKKKAVPEVLLQVVEAKRLLDSERVLTVQEATEAVGISRSSFYKYKDDIFPFHENNRGRTITFMLQMDDQPGLLSVVLSENCTSGMGIAMIHCYHMIIIRHNKLVERMRDITITDTHNPGIRIGDFHFIGVHLNGDICLMIVAIGRFIHFMARTDQKPSAVISHTA